MMFQKDSSEKWIDRAWLFFSNPYDTSFKFKINTNEKWILCSEVFEIISKCNYKYIHHDICISSRYLITYVRFDCTFFFSAEYWTFISSSCRFLQIWKSEYQSIQRSVGYVGSSSRI